MMNDNEQHLIVEPHGLARGFVSEYTNKVKILKTFANYEEAYIYYIDLIKEKYNYIIPDDLWLIFINDNNITQFEQLKLEIKTKIVEIH